MWPQYPLGGAVDGGDGAYLEYTLKSTCRFELRETSRNKAQYLWVRAGYGRGGNIGREGLGDFNGRRILLKVTGRASSKAVWLAHRGRLVLRSIEERPLGASAIASGSSENSRQNVRRRCPTRSPGAFTKLASTS